MLGTDPLKNGRILYLLEFDGARRRHETDRAGPGLSSLSGLDCRQTAAIACASYPEAAEAEEAGRDEDPRARARFVDLQAMQTGSSVNRSAETVTPGRAKLETVTSSAIQTSCNTNGPKH